MAKKEKTMLGLTKKNHQGLKELKSEKYFNEMLDGYRIGISLAASKGKISPESVKSETIFSSATLDPNGEIKSLVLELFPESKADPYRFAERLAEWGVGELIRLKKSRSLSFSKLSENTNKSLDAGNKSKFGGLSESDAERIIIQGETGTVEFKSTIRKNLFTNKNDHEIEHAAIKTLAAFMNSVGGTLIIGLSDSKEALGLSGDGFANEDKFNLHLVNLVKEKMGIMAFECIKSYFVNYQNKRIMLVTCEKAKKPIYVKHENTEKFFIRLGPSTHELSVREAQDYIAERFVDAQA